MNNKFIKRNPTTNFIAKLEDDVVGVILCGYDGRRGYFDLLSLNNRFVYGERM
ncbi:hypothetical protein [Clostridium yunnanense]|uniref:hypothetical protein n=1 Tax=Clostridium yunnanense TaxID=2800325 RepID=UPI001FAD7211|nr:hypothetical protein [Clostridium yunnanense]